MNVFPLANANASVISVTGTAAYILALIDTAGSTAHTFPKAVDALDITPEDGDIRIVVSPVGTGTSPTATKGFLIKQGATLMLRHTDIRTVKAISTSGTVSCSLQVGLSEQTETTVVSGGGGAITSVIPGTGATNLGKATGGTYASGDTGVGAWALRQDTPAALEADGEYVPPTVEGSKGTRVTLGSLISGEDQTRNGMHTLDTGTATRITSAATTACRNSSGSIRRIIVKVALTGTVSIYNHPSTATNLIDVLPIGLAVGTYNLGYEMSNGVVVVTSAADDITVVTDR